MVAAVEPSALKVRDLDHKQLLIQIDPLIRRPSTGDYTAICDVNLIPYSHAFGAAQHRKVVGSACDLVRIHVTLGAVVELTRAAGPTPGREIA